MVADTESDFSLMYLSADKIKIVCAALYPRVVKLDLPMCRMDASGTASLTASLEKLCLYNNQLTDAGAHALAASIPFCPELTDVDKLS